MKKWIVIICVIFLAIAGAFYFYIPTSQPQAYQTTTGCSEIAVSRHMINKTKWQSWWPGQKVNDSTYNYQNYTYRFDRMFFNGMETTVYSNYDTLKGFLQFVYLSNDSTKFQFASNYDFSINPVKRFGQYFRIKKMRNATTNLLAEMKRYFDNPQNIYGLNIVKEKISESSMISVKNTFKTYPSNSEIYGMIQSVKEFIKKRGGEENGFPMFHVHNEVPGIFETMVAVPTKTELATEGRFQLKKMREGFMLSTEVNGGPGTVQKSETELTNFVNDYKQNSPAIPFQSLVTDRLLQPDSTKWITRLYYPIF